jgi:hypothetical protein
MKKETIALIGASVVVLCVILYFVTKKKESYCGCSGPTEYHNLKTVNDMGQPWTFKKCLCSQMGNKYYASQDALTRKLFRNVSEWGYNGETLSKQDIQKHEFSGVV